jgi:tRNA threonylcarbamoyladenosine biosynthesis protein TsaB
VIVLGFDTATQASAVGLRLPGGQTLTARDNPPPGEHPGHATRLLAMARELLAQADIRWAELERLAVGVGPGRFTGLRVGIATARGLAQSLDTQLVGVSSLRALGLAAAHDASEKSSSGAHEQPRRGTIAVIDARRGESFVAAYPAEADFAALADPSAPADPATKDSPRTDELVFPRALRPAELTGILGPIEQRGGPHSAPWRAVGDGAVLYEEALAAGGVGVVPHDSPLHLVDGAAICELGALASASACVASFAAVVPDYRRSPDAALARPQTSGGSTTSPSTTSTSAPAPAGTGASSVGPGR